MSARPRCSGRSTTTAPAAGPTDFWHLNLPAETRAYVPKLLALKRLMAEPERYGLEFAAIPNEPYFAVIDTGSQIDLKIAAQLAGTSYDELIALNPGYQPLGDRSRRPAPHVGADRQRRRIRGGDSRPCRRRTACPTSSTRWRKRETLATIAKQYGTSAAVIAKINDLPGGRVSAGETLKIPQISGQLPDKVLLAAARVDRPETDRRPQAAADRLPRSRGRDAEQHCAPPRHAGEHAGAAQ